MSFSFSTWKMAVFSFSFHVLETGTRAFVHLCIHIELGVNLERSSFVPSCRLVHIIRSLPVNVSVDVALEAQNMAESTSLTLLRLIAGPVICNGEA